ncbi:MAG: CARDB domain-containing protein [Candidatus Diapherotrites archaeon]
MEVKAFNGILIAIIVLLLLFVYWFIPLDTTEFNPLSSSNSNFSPNASENNTLQFYQNMRFPSTSISYKIEGCPLQREDDMEWAFEIMEEKTILDFYPVTYGESITVTCEETEKARGRLFIAGEGGPTNITISGDFNVIESGQILLMKNSDCERPNIALHELLHVLGFNHSINQKNIMYEISRCDQTIGSDIIDFINEIYSIPSQPDLLFENASASMHGKYLNINFSIRNSGLEDAQESIVRIIADGKEVEEIQIPEIEIGYGRKVSVTNILIKQINVERIEFVIENNFEEMSKTNNKVVFEIKK